MGQREHDEEPRAQRGGVTRRDLAASLAAAAVVVAITPRPARADLFGGDVGVMLAQLEQQLQLVTNAIQTVQQLMESVRRLGAIADQGKTLLQQATGKGGLDGILNGVKGLAMAGRGATRNLQVLNTRGGYWKDTIAARARVGESLSLGDSVKMSAEAFELNGRFLRDIGNVTSSFGEIAQSSDALQAASDAVSDAAAVQGMVGQTQLVGRQVFQLARIATQHAGASTTHASLYADELTREAWERQRGELEQRRIFDEEEFDRVDDAPTQIDFELDTPW
jgi:hypothetical protein